MHSFTIKDLENLSGIKAHTIRIWEQRYSFIKPERTGTNIRYYSNDEYSFSKPYSERTAELIDEEVKRMINEQYDRAKAILSEHKDGHNELARLLVEKEVIFAEDVERIFGKRPWTSRSEEIMALEATAKPVEVTEDFEEKNSSDSEEKEKEKKEA